MRVILKLAIDAVRRQIGWRFAFFLYLWGYAFMKAPLKIFPRVDRLAVAMTASTLLLLGIAGLVESRELFQLPVSRAVWWRVRWMLGVVAGSSCAVLVVALADWDVNGRWPPVTTLAVHLITTMTFCALAHTAWVRWFNDWEDTPATVGFLAKDAWGLTIPALPFALAPFLPHDLASVDWRHGLLLIGAAPFAAPGLVYRPRVAARLWQRPPTPGEAAQAGPRIASPSWFDRFTGLRQWLWIEARRVTVALGVGLCGLGLVTMVLAATKGVSLLQLWQKMALAVGSSSRSEAAAGLLAFATLFALPYQVRPWTANLRAIRCMPGAHVFLPLVPSTTGLIASGAFLAWFTVTHVFVTLTLPTRVPVEALAVLAAMVTLYDTMRLTIPESLVPDAAMITLGGTAVCMAPLLAAEQGWWPSSQMAVALWSATSAISVALVHWSIAHNTRLYQRRSTAMRVG